MKHVVNIKFKKADSSTLGCFWIYCELRLCWDFTEKVLTWVWDTPSQAASQTRAKASTHWFHSSTWRASAALGSVSVEQTLYYITAVSTVDVSLGLSVKDSDTTKGNKLTEDIIGSTTAATSVCLARSRGRPISKVAAARRRTLEAECTTSGTTSLAHVTAPSPIWAGTCSNILQTPTHRPNQHFRYQEKQCTYSRSKN